MQPIDELFIREYSLIYTTDPNMATFKGQDKMPVQVLYSIAKSMNILLQCLLQGRFRSFASFFWRLS